MTSEFTQLIVSDPTKTGTNYDYRSDDVANPDLTTGRADDERAGRGGLSETFIVTD